MIAQPSAHAMVARRARDAGSCPSGPMPAQSPDLDEAGRLQGARAWQAPALGPCPSSLASWNLLEHEAVQLIPADAGVSSRACGQGARVQGPAGFRVKGLHKP